MLTRIKTTVISLVTINWHIAVGPVTIIAATMIATVAATMVVAIFTIS